MKRITLRNDVQNYLRKQDNYQVAMIDHVIYAKQMKLK